MVRYSATDPAAYLVVAAAASRFLTACFSNFTSAAFVLGIEPRAKANCQTNRRTAVPTRLTLPNVQGDGSLKNGKRLRIRHRHNDCPG